MFDTCDHTHYQKHKATIKLSFLMIAFESDLFIFFTYIQ
jgi:hypothetical protein